jgi:hypothetical protein
MIKKTKTAFKVIVVIALFASFIATGCNNEKKEEEKEPVKTEEPAPAPAPVTGDTTGVDTNNVPKPGPVTPVNK